MQLPYEIWKMIMSYLPVREAKELYSVNSALFDIAMDLRYQQARLWAGSPKARVRQDSRVFRYPDLSSRPRALLIDLSSIAKSLSRRYKGNPHSLLRIIPLIVSIVTRGKFNYPDSVPEIVAVAVNALPQLTAITDIHITYDYNGSGRDDPLVLRLIGDVWRIFGDRLRYLQVRVAFENLELLLPTALHLPHLQRLAINAKGFNNTTLNGYGSMVSTMIQANSTSLRDVSFTTNTPVDFQPIFRTLRDVPHLQAIQLSLPFGPFIPRPFPMYDMLNNCRHQLEFLSLNFETHMREHASHSLSLFHEGWCSVDLPRLKELRIDPPIRAFGQDFIDYIHRFALSLISLSIKPNLRLRYHEAEQLSSIFHHFLSLRNLSICIRCLCPHILALLAQTLPRLQTLNLWYSCISPTTDEQILIDPELSRLFYRVMQQHVRIFREWQLVSLDYSPFSIHSMSAQIEKALTDHLPNVEWFCGLERLTYLRRAQQRPPTPLLLPVLSIATL